ncbi:MAG: hypothetical protein RL748_1477, partial [Pseudomonadota bacterium]
IGNGDGFIDDGAGGGFQADIATGDITGDVFDIALGFDIELVVGNDAAADIAERLAIKIDVVGGDHRAGHNAVPGRFCQIHDWHQYPLTGHFTFNHPDDVAIQTGQLIRAGFLTELQAELRTLRHSLIHQRLHLRRFIAIALDDIATGLGDQLLAYQIGFVVGITQAFFHLIRIKPQTLGQIVGANRIGTDLEQRIGLHQKLAVRVFAGNKKAVWIGWQVNADGIAIGTRQAHHTGGRHITNAIIFTAIIQRHIADTTAAAYAANGDRTGPIATVNRGTIAGRAAIGAAGATAINTAHCIGQGAATGADRACAIGSAGTTGRSSTSGVGAGATGVGSKGRTGIGQTKTAGIEGSGENAGTDAANGGGVLQDAAIVVTTHMVVISSRPERNIVGVNFPALTIIALLQGQIVIGEAGTTTRAGKVDGGGRQYAAHIGGVTEALQVQGAAADNLRFEGRGTTGETLLVNPGFGPVLNFVIVREAVIGIGTVTVIPACRITIPFARITTGHIVMDGGSVDGDVASGIDGAAIGEAVGSDIDGAARIKRALRCRHGGVIGDAAAAGDIELFTGIESTSVGDIATAVQIEFGQRRQASGIAVIDAGGANGKVATAVHGTFIAEGTAQGHGAGAAVGRGQKDGTGTVVAEAGGIYAAACQCLDAARIVDAATKQAEGITGQFGPALVIQGGEMAAGTDIQAASGLHGAAISQAKCGVVAVDAQGVAAQQYGTRTGIIEAACHVDAKAACALQGAGIIQRRTASSQTGAVSRVQHAAVVDAAGGNKQGVARALGQHGAAIADCAVALYMDATARLHGAGVGQATQGQVQIMRCGAIGHQYGAAVIQGPTYGQIKAAIGLQSTGIGAATCPAIEHIRQNSAGCRIAEAGQGGATATQLQGLQRLNAAVIAEGKAAAMTRYADIAIADQFAGRAGIIKRGGYAGIQGTMRCQGAGIVDGGAVGSKAGAIGSAQQTTVIDAATSQAQVASGVLGDDGATIANGGGALHAQIAAGLQGAAIGEAGNGEANILPGGSAEYRAGIAQCTGGNHGNAVTALHDAVIGQTTGLQLHGIAQQHRTGAIVEASGRVGIAADCERLPCCHATSIAKAKTAATGAQGDIAVGKHPAIGPGIAEGGGHGQIQCAHRADAAAVVDIAGGRHQAGGIGRLHHACISQAAGLQAQKAGGILGQDRAAIAGCASAVQAQVITGLQHASVIHAAERQVDIAATGGRKHIAAIVQSAAGDHGNTGIALHSTGIGDAGAGAAEGIAQ